MKSAMPYSRADAPELKAAAPAAAGRAPLRRPDRRGRPTAAALWTTQPIVRSGTPPSRCCATRHYQPWVDVDLLPLLEHLVRTGAWWDFVDEIASHLVGPGAARPTGRA